MKENQKDFCTFFPDNILGHDISQCCKAHDIAYLGEIPKYKADIELMQCVSGIEDGSALMPVVGALMFMGVSLFGFMFYKRK